MLNTEDRIAQMETRDKIKQKITEGLGVLGLAVILTVLIYGILR